uniref:Uncharacterized protein n=1 Tax=Oryza rufipogon TaxID=4529 RepID=A0A0E0Q0E9_ORYRU
MAATSQNFKSRFRWWHGLPVVVDGDGGLPASRWMTAAAAAAPCLSAAAPFASWVVPTLSRKEEQTPEVEADGGGGRLPKIRPASPLLLILLHFSTLSPSLSPLTSLDTRHPHIHTPSTRSGGGIRLHARVVATTGRFILRLQTGGRRRLPRPTSDRWPPDLAYGARIWPPRPLPPPPATSPPPVASSYATPPPPARSGGSRLHRGLSPHHGSSTSPLPVASSSTTPPLPARSGGSRLHRTANRWIRRPLPPTAGVVHRLLHPLALPPFPTLEIKWNSRRLKSLLTIGAILWVIAGAAVFVLPSQMHNLIYPLAVVIGAANTLVMLTTIGLESALVGDDLNGYTFVYGSLSFLDKIHLESPCSSSNPTKLRRDDALYTMRTGLIPSCFAVFVLLVPLLLPPLHWKLHSSPGVCRILWAVAMHTKLPDRYTKGYRSRHLE